MQHMPAHMNSSRRLYPGLQRGNHPLQGLKSARAGAMDYGVYNKHHVRLGFRMRWTQAPLFAEFYVQPACAWIQFSWTHARPNDSL